VLCHREEKEDDEENEKERKRKKDKNCDIFYLVERNKITSRPAILPVTFFSLHFSALTYARCCDYTKHITYILLELIS